MGGFHGGHSGGRSGGFHGGSSRSHSSHSTTHHYSHSSFHIYSKGRSSNSYNRSRVANIFVYFFLSLLFIIFAIVVFALCMDVAVKATITKAQITKSGYYKYEVYCTNKVQDKEDYTGIKKTEVSVLTENFDLYEEK